MGPSERLKTNAEQLSRSIFIPFFKSAELALLILIRFESYGDACKARNFYTR